MKKSLIIAGLACVALAACTKNEVVSVAPDQEITFQTISTKTADAMDTDKKFYSWAFFLPQSKTWNSNKSDASKYINRSLIEYVSSSSSTAWKNASTTYFWPKQGSLTFFALSDNTNAGCTIAGADAYIDCNNTDGVVIGNFSVTNNANKDLLVAKISEDQTQNTTNTGTWSKGVPTVFYHVLSAIEVKAQTLDTYTGATIKIQNIEFDDVKVKGVYKQGVDESKTPLDGTWTLGAETSNLTITGVESSVLSTTPASLTQVYQILMPQKFDDETAKAKIVYTITTSYTGTPVTETVTETIPLKTLFNTPGSEWKSGRKYVLTLKIGLNEILWDPSVEPWSKEIFDYNI